jgi:phosphatidylethanolamine-binding protein (PEBP) family uncharacterized protein
MAQGRVAQRLLARFVRTTSAGVFLALVVLALLLAGCGGGSSDNSSSDGATSAAPDSSASGGSSSADVNGSNAAGVEAGAEAGDPAAGSARSASGSLAQGGGGGQESKHATHLPQPKGAPEPGITPQQRREATVASMVLESPSSQPSSGGPQALPAEFTCDGKDSSPALRWHGVPGGSAELVLFAMNARPVGGELFFDWAVAGLDPGLEEIEAGELPRGAVVGRNSFGKTGYEICPEGGGETFIFTLFALPRKLSPSQGFEPLALRKAVAEASGNVGLLALSYLPG